MKDVGRRVLIDEWFPLGEVGVESVRERSATSALPPIYFLHVWFARRPLTTSRATILGSLLPPQIDRKQFLRLLGIPADKDVVGAAKLLGNAKAQNRKLASNPFSWERSFKHVLSTYEVKWLEERLKSYWDERIPAVLDPMAGGGSIPYEAVRLGLPAIAGDLNPVAYVCLKATVEYPAKFGQKLIYVVRDFCSKIHTSARKELEEFYPRIQGEKVFTYLWSRTVKCQHCGLTIPLSPNWWIVRSDGEKIAAKPVPDKTGNICSS